MDQPESDSDEDSILYVADGVVYADSRDVAAYFGKSHPHVFRDIHALNCSKDFRRSNFGSFKNKGLAGKSTSHVEMTKDGFAFVVLGFTGAKAGRAFSAKRRYRRTRMPVRPESPLPADIESKSRCRCPPSPH